LPAAPSPFDFKSPKKLQPIYSNHPPTQKMNAKSLNLFAMASAVLLTATVAQGQSLIYSNAVASLNPAGYWPMHEVEAPAPGDIETNYGTLGVLGNAYYPDYQVNVGAFLHQMPGALANDPSPSVFFRGPSNAGTATNGLFVPHTSPLATVKAPFTLECWMMATNEGIGQGDILSQADGSKTQGFRIYYQNNTTGDIAGLAYFGSASVGLTFTAGSASNQWHHLVWTCDAKTNMAVYCDGVQGGILGTKTTVAEVGKFKPDAHEPFAVGTGLGFQRAFSGLVDEVAVYTNVITDISQHYNDGISGGSGAYYQDVINDNPAIYLRMDSSAYSAPAGPWPTLLNYGQTNGVAVANGVYAPGTLPGLVAGTAYNNFPADLSSPNVAPLSGVSSFADAGSAAVYNPAGATPFTVAALFRGNPTDTNRVQSIVGHGTNSWELGVIVGGSLVFNAGTNSTAVVATGTGAGDLVSTTNIYDDGNWHWVVATHNNTTNVLYVDGVANNTNVLAAANSVGNSLDVMIGSDPSYTNTPIGLGRQFAGQVCEVAFFTNALTIAQVQTLYSSVAFVAAITQQPVSATNNQNSAFTNTVVATGTGLNYQWFQSTDGGITFLPATGQNTAHLIFNPVLPADAGYWYVAVTNLYSAVTSSVVSLTVYSVPTFSQDLTSTNVVLYPGGSASFSVAAVGAQPIHYQWYFNGTPVANATNLSYTLANAQPPNTANIVYCIATNVAGNGTSPNSGLSAGHYWEQSPRLLALE
jgi:prepilin-type processing-associated H-X9-DG protein